MFLSVFSLAVLGLRPLAVASQFSFCSVIVVPEAGVFELDVSLKKCHRSCVSRVSPDASSELSAFTVIRADTRVFYLSGPVLRNYISVIYFHFTTPSTQTSVLIVSLGLPD